MFEKEAKERARKLEESQTLGVYYNEEDYERDIGWNEGEVSGYEEGFKDGAEFGYNKAKKEMQKQGLALQSDMDKTIEQNIQLKKQIEKMKCCENCKHSDTECEGYTICGIGHYDDCLSNKVLYHTTDEKDYWELEEND